MFLNALMVLRFYCTLYGFKDTEPDAENKEQKNSTVSVYLLLLHSTLLVPLYCGFSFAFATDDESTFISHKTKNK